MNKKLKELANFIQFLVRISGKDKRNSSDVFFGHFLLFLLTLALIAILFVLGLMLKSLTGWIIIGFIVGLVVLVKLNRLMWLGLSKGIEQLISAGDMIKKLELKLEAAKTALNEESKTTGTE